MRIHIGHHFYGAGNIGDDFMLEGFLAGIAEWSQRLDVTCCTPFRIDTQARRFPQIGWRANRLAEQIDAVRTCDVWLGLGDTPFQSDVGNWMLDHLLVQVELCRRFRKPMIYLGIGINDEDALALPQSRQIVDRAQRIWARDQLSADALSAIAPASTVGLGADLSHLFFSELAIQDVLPKDSLGLILNFERDDLFDATVLKELSCNSRFKRIHWLIQEVRLLKGSERELLSRLSRETYSRLNVCAPAYESRHTADLVAAWPVTDTVASSRYHGLLASAWRGARLIAVKRSTKILGAAQELEVPHGPMADLPMLFDRARAVPRDRLRQLRLRAGTMIESFLLEIGVLPDDPMPSPNGRETSASPSPSHERPAGRPRYPAKDIAVLRLDNLGDMVLCSGFFRELRRLYPGARIIAFAHGIGAEYLSACPYVNHVVTVRENIPEIERLGRIDAFADAFRKRFRGAFDLVINPRHGLDHYGAALLARLTEAPIRIAYADAGSGLTTDLADAYTIVVEQWAAPRPHPELNAGILETLSDLAHDPGIESWPDSMTLTKWWHRLREASSDDRQHYLLGIGASHAGSRWPAANFAIVARALLDRHGLIPILTGAAAEKPFAAAIVSGLQVPCLNLTGETSIRDLVAIAHFCDLYVGNDSGPKHIAAAAKVSVVEINWLPAKRDCFGPQDPAYFRPYGVDCRVLRPRSSFDKAQIVSGTAIGSIEPQDVIAAAEDLLTIRGHR